MTLEPNRRSDEALAWVEDITGGRIVSSELAARWRPTWSLDVEMPDGTVLPLMLRGYRAPIGPDEQSFRDRLAMEAGFLAALQNTSIAVPKYYGHEPIGGWFLMERVGGTPMVTKVADPDRQRHLMRQYMSTLAELHKLDPDSLDLPKSMMRAHTYEEGVGQMLGEFRATYDLWPNKDPEPLVDLCDWWLTAHRPAAAPRFSVTPGDIGPDQFMFDDSGLQAIFDLEMAYVGDPMQDIGLMRLRNMCYPIPNLPEYIDYWADLVGREIDRTTLCWWTIAGMIASPLYVYPIWVAPFPTMVKDATAVHAFIPIHRRGACEALAEFYGFTLDPPAQPPAEPGLAAKYATWLSGQVREFYLPRAAVEDSFELQCTQALADVAVLAATFGSGIERANLADLSTLLGQEFGSVRDGLAALSERIRIDPESDLEQSVLVLHAIESRHEFLLEPIQTFCGFRSGVPLEPYYHGPA
jgi:aminoglycoside phosphotransferase (APT) family kinase protein